MTDQPNALRLADAIGANRMTLGLEAATELRRLHQRVADYEEDYKAVMAEHCAGDELHCSCVPHLRRGIKELQAKNEALRADAERYRWMRDPANAYRDEWDLFGPYSSAEEIDTAIDAARSKP